MNYNLLLNTVVHLKLTQVIYQVKNRFVKAKFVQYVAPKARYKYETAWCDKWQCCHLSQMQFLNIANEFTNWNETKHGMLWAYNLNYMDWLCQEGMSFEDGSFWISCYCKAIANGEVRIGLDPYPIALRSINWVKFICKHKVHISEVLLTKWNDTLYSQALLLEKKLEYHLLGNHLLEDAYALYIVGCYFEQSQTKSVNLKQKAYKLLIKQLKEQILNDGAHYELSPMYHCILLDRLLDCINFGRTAELEIYAKHMVGHLKSITFEDGSIPMMNDAANGVAPTVTQLIDYAKRLGVDYDAIALSDSGYRHFYEGKIECIADFGTISASYQPGHTHADVMNYELRINGRLIVVDTGISTYNKTARRQYERSSKAHNVISVKNGNSSEIWGGFRVAKRAKVNVTNDTVTVKTAYGVVLSRSFKTTADSLIITDSSEKAAVSRIHLHPLVVVESVSNSKIKTNAGTITIEGSTDVEVLACEVSVEYNKLMPTKCIEIAFCGKMKYEIK